MDSFKLKPGKNKVYSISEKLFSEVTGDEKPYCAKRGAQDSYYAVCPECDNPIQIVGLYKSTIESGKKPYGRHYKGTIPHLAEYCEEDYELCDYANPEWKRPYGKRSPDSKIAKRTLALLKEQYDRVVYVLSKEIEIKISNSLARELLRQYLISQGWRYNMATLNNLPWVLLEANGAHSLFGRYIQKDGELHKKLKESCATVDFQISDDGKYVKIINNSKKEYVNIYFHMYNHTKKVIEDHLQENSHIGYTKALLQISYQFMKKKLI